MRIRTVTGILAAVVFLGLSASCTLHGQPPAPQRRAAPLPFGCYIQVWDDLFKVTKTSYDKTSNQVSWLLEVKKDTPVSTYVADLKDPEGTFLASAVPVKFEPNYSTLRKGAKVKATVAIGSVDSTALARVIVRVQR